MIWIGNVPAVAAIARDDRAMLVAADMLHASWEGMASFMGIG